MAPQPLAGPRIVFHAGMPKTGTSSLQRFLAADPRALQSQGVVYPQAGRPGPGATGSAKHGILVHRMRSGDVAGFRQDLTAAQAECGAGAHTLVISNEALFGRWDEIPGPVRQALAEFARSHRVEWWLWLREPASFAKSQYIQALKNRWRGLGLGHGEDLSFEEILEKPWFQRRLDYGAYLREVEQLLGAGAIRLFVYGEDTVLTFCTEIGLQPPAPGRVRSNRVLGELGVRLVRRLNRMGVSGRRRRMALAMIEWLDAAAPGSRPFSPPAQAQARIRELAAPSLALLARDYGVVFPATGP